MKVNQIIEKYENDKFLKDIPIEVGPYNQDNGGNYKLMDIIDQMLDDGIEPTVQNMYASMMVATQDYLDPTGLKDNESEYPEYSDKPIVLSYEGRYHIIDGHHRCSEAFLKQKRIAVYLFGEL